MSHPSTQKDPDIFSGNIYFFHAFDVGDDVNLDKIAQLSSINVVTVTIPRYFKNYQMPLAIDLPRGRGAKSPRCMNCKIHNFGAISLTYKIPFNDTLDNVHKKFNDLFNEYQEQSISDVKAVFKEINNYIIKPKFFDIRSSYVVIQVDPQPHLINVEQLQTMYGNIITSMLRFELESLSEDQHNEILDSAIGYFRGDLIIVDIDATFAYDDEFEEIKDFFEFANIQQLELRYFDRFLDEQLNRIYEEGVQKLSIKSYLPFIGILASDPVGDLGKLKADISVITERLESSIKIAGEPYFSELYELLVKKLDLKNWRSAIDRKLAIIHDVRVVYQHKTDAIREDLVSALIVLLIFIELIIGILSYLK